MKEAILSNNTPVDNSLTSTGNSSDKTSCELTIADLPTPCTSSSPPSPTPQQPSTSNRFNSDHSSGSPIDLLTKNNSDEQLNYIFEHESSASVHDSQNSSKKMNNKKVNRKPTTMSSDTVKGQKSIKAAIEAMKRKLSPEKESDTSRDNNKMSRNEHSPT